MKLTRRKKGAKSGSVIVESLIRLALANDRTTALNCAFCLLFVSRLNISASILYISTLNPFMAIPSSKRISNLSLKACGAGGKSSN